MSTADKLNKILETKADIKQALIDKGQNPSDVFSTYADDIRAINGSIWTGHVDVEGLKAIGWDGEDIAYFQEHGVNWMEEDDEYYKVSEDNKALYGVLTADNIQEYKDRIVYLPKIDINRNDISNLFKDCFYLKALPILDTSKIEKMEYTFSKCSNLVYIPKWNLNNLRYIMNAFEYCYSLMFIDASLNNVLSLGSTFTNCYNIKFSSNYKISPKSFRYAFLGSSSMVTCPIIEASNIPDFTGSFTNCYSLLNCKIENLKKSVSFYSSSLLSKQSVLFTINNEAATEPITITLHADAYARLATDSDIIAALEDHPLISLASV